MPRPACAGSAPLAVGLQGFGEPGSPMHRRAGGARLVRQPVRRRRRTHRGADLHAFGLGEYPQLQLRHLHTESRVISTSVEPSSSGRIDHTGVPATEPSSALTDATTADTG